MFIIFAESKGFINMLNQSLSKWNYKKDLNSTANVWNLPNCLCKN